MYSRKILCHADLPKRWKLEKHTPYWDINVQSINRLKNMVRHIPGKLVFAPILKNWRVIYYILLFMRSFPALWTQSAGIVQYRHLVISGFSTKCRYCSIPALCHFRFAYKVIFNTVISRILQAWASPFLIVNATRPFDE